jgi:ABC-type Fe3+-siderophore transport system permease subunit
VPHLLRNFYGFDNRFILPASALLGGTLLVWVVLLSNSFSGINVPVSMLTASIGGPVFLYSVARLGRRV